MSINSPTHFPLTATHLASEVVEFSPIEAVPEGRHLLRAATWAYASGCRRQVLGLDFGLAPEQSVKTIVGPTDPYETLAVGSGKLSPSGRRLLYSFTCQRVDFLIEVYALVTGTPLVASVSFMHPSTDPIGRTELSGEIDFSSYVWPRVSIDIYILVKIRRSTTLSSFGRVWGGCIVEAPIPASDLPL